MAILSRLLVALGVDASEFESGLRGAEGVASSSAANIGTKLEGIGNKLMPLGARMTAAVTLPLMALGTAAVKAASDLDESLNKVNVVFGESAAEITAWSETSAEAFGLSQRGALEAAGTFGNLFVSMGMLPDAASSMSQSLVELAGDLASFNNIPVDVALEKLRSGLVGEVEPLRTLGVNINAAAVQAEALRLGLIGAGEEMTAQEAVQARYSLIMQQTSTAQGDFARTSDGLANSTRIAKAEIENAAAALGEKLMPLAADAVGFVSELVQGFTNLPEPLQASALGLAGIAAAAGPLTAALGGLSKALALIYANPVIAGIALVVVGIAALAMHISNVKDKADETAAGILDTATSYEEYRKGAENAGVASQIVTEELWNVYQGAKAAGEAIDQLAFQKAAGEAQALAESLMLVNWAPFYDGTEEAIGQTGLFQAGLEQEISRLSDLEVEILNNEASIRQWAAGTGLAGEELDRYVQVVYGAAAAEDYHRARMVDSRAEIEAEREALERLRGKVGEVESGVSGAGSATYDFATRLEELTGAAESAEAAMVAQGLSATTMQEILQGAAGPIESIISGLVARWDELTAAEQRAAEVAVAQALLGEAQEMLVAGQITVGQFAELWGALAGTLGSLVDPAQVTTDQIMWMFGQWALGGQVTALDLATSVGNMGMTMDTAVLDAQAAESAFVAAFRGPVGPIQELDTKLVTLGKRISEIPDPDPIRLQMTGYEETLKQLGDVAGGVNNIPTHHTVTVEVVLTGNPNILPQSPHTMMEYALQNLAATAGELFPLTVGINAGGTLPANGFGWAGGASGAQGGAGGGDTFIIHNHNQLAAAMNQAWIEQRRRERLNGSM